MSMEEAIAFDCQNCGASLELNPKDIVVTCGHCKSQHKMTRKDGNISAEIISVIEELKRDTRTSAITKTIQSLLDKRKELWEQGLETSEKIENETNTDKMATIWQMYHIDIRSEISTLFGDDLAKKYGKCFFRLRCAERKRLCV